MRVSLLLPYSLSHMFFCYIYILPTPSPAKQSLVFIFTRYYLHKHFGFAGWELRTVFCPDPHVKKGYVYQMLSSEDGHDLGIAAVLILGGTCWNEKIPHKEIRHKLSSEVACSVSFYYFFFKKMISDFPLASTQDSLLSNL